jgi:pimeloyl-ACP methyl ester carboxylesterase
VNCKRGAGYLQKPRRSVERIRNLAAMAFGSYLPCQLHTAALPRRRCCSPPLWRACASPQRFPACFPEEPAAEITDPLAIRMMRGCSVVEVSAPSLCDTPILTSYFSTAGSTQDNLPPVVFLHGFDSNLLEYRRLAVALEHMPFRSYFVDILGWGFTEKPPTSSTLTYSPADKRAHLLAWKQAVVGDAAIVLAGASIGGGAAVDFALAHPKEVQALVLIGGQTYLDKPASSLMSIPVLGDAIATVGATVLRSRWLRKIAVYLSYHDPVLRMSEEIARIGGLHTTTPGWLEANSSFIKSEGYCVSERVARLRLPSLVIYGEEDRILPSDETATRLFGDLGGPDLVTVVPVPDAGHSPHIETPTSVAWALADFVRNLRDS